MAPRNPLQEIDMITLFLAGKARVGKTTAAEMLAKMAKKYDYKPVILPFAKAIKDAASAAGLTKEANPHEYRAFCQKLGEEKRAENPFYWVEQFDKEWRKLVEADNAASQDPDKLWKETVCIVDDCRYPNELDYGKKIGATLIFISSGNRELSDHNGEWRQHESEMMANNYEVTPHAGNPAPFGYIVKNDGSKKRFQTKLQERLLTWLGATPFHYTACECEGCKKMRVDEQITIEDLFKEIFGDDDDDDGA